MRHGDQTQAQSLKAEATTDSFRNGSGSEALLAIHTPFSCILLRTNPHMSSLRAARWESLEKLQGPEVPLWGPHGKARQGLRLRQLPEGASRHCSLKPDYQTPRIPRTESKKLTARPRSRPRLLLACKIKNNTLQHHRRPFCKSSLAAAARAASCMGANFKQEGS